MTAFSWYLAWVLLPLVPAIILYLIFPKSEASIETPEAVKPDDGKKESLLHKLTKGFAIKLGGAVAVYFLVFYLINPVKNKWYEKPDDRWQLRASFKDDNGKFIPFSQLRDIEMIPNINFEEFDNNSALIHLSGVREEGNKVNVPYSIRLSFTGYEPITLSLSDSMDSKSFCEKIKDKKLIKISPQSVKGKVVQQDDLRSTVETLSEKIIN